MQNLFILGFSFFGWLSDATRELSYFFNHMSIVQWGIVAAAATAFGFLCLKGTKVNR